MNLISLLRSILDGRVAGLTFVHGHEIINLYV